MNRDDFLRETLATRREFDAALALLSEAQLLRPGGWGAWTVKDMIAHVTWYEREMAGVLRTRVFSGSPWWELPADKRNRQIHAQNKDRPLREVLEESRNVFAELRDLLAGLSDADLADPARFAETPPGWLPWQVIASNTFEHYPDHTADLKKAFGEITK